MLSTDVPMNHVPRPEVTGDPNGPLDDLWWTYGPHICRFLLPNSSFMKSFKRQEGVDVGFLRLRHHWFLTTTNGQRGETSTVRLWAIALACWWWSHLLLHPCWWQPAARHWKARERMEKHGMQRFLEVNFLHRGPYWKARLQNSGGASRFSWKGEVTKANMNGFCSLRPFFALITIVLVVLVACFGCLLTDQLVDRHQLWWAAYQWRYLGLWAPPSLSLAESFSVSFTVTQAEWLERITWP